MIPLRLYYYAAAAVALLAAVGTAYTVGRLQAVARKGYGRRFWVEQPPTMSAIDSRSDKTPPRTE